MLICKLRIFGLRAFYMPFSRRSTCRFTEMGSFGMKLGINILASCTSIRKNRSRHGDELLVNSLGGGAFTMIWTCLSARLLYKEKWAPIFFSGINRYLSFDRDAFKPFVDQRIVAQ